MHNKKLPLIYIFPNLVTIISLCFGMSAIRYGLDTRWELAVSLLVASAFLDGMDGRLARMLNASSKFGAELDSLTDFINFGVAPSLILYSWGLNYLPIKAIGWGIALTFTICSAFRLARFNTEFTLLSKYALFVCPVKFSKISRWISCIIPSITFFFVSTTSSI